MDVNDQWHEQTYDFDIKQEKTYNVFGPSFQL
jgi:hypothetical protein